MGRGLVGTFFARMQPHLSFARNTVEVSFEES